MGRRSKKAGVFAAIAEPVMRKAEPPKTSVEQALSQDPLIPHFVKHMDGTTARSFLAAMQGMRRKRYEGGAGYVRNNQPAEGHDDRYDPARHTFIAPDHDPQNFFRGDPEVPPVAFDWNTRQLVKPVSAHSKVGTLMGEPEKEERTYIYRPARPVTLRKPRARYGVQIGPQSEMKLASGVFPGNYLDDEELRDSINKERRRWDKSEIPAGNTYSDIEHSTDDDV
jgi:hypothetical protein